MKQVADLTRNEDSLKDKISKKVDELKGYVSLLNYVKDKAKRNPNFMRATAKDDVESIEA